MSYKPGKLTRLNYLSQVSVDTANHVITHIQAFHADKGDGQCFPEVLKHTVDNLRENEPEIEEVNLFQDDTRSEREHFPELILIIIQTLQQ